MSAMVEQECCICFEIIGEKNNCVTPCGHKFCFMCVTKSLSQNNTCPCCRSVLLEVNEDDDDDSEYDDDDDNDESDSDDGNSNEGDDSDDEDYTETGEDAEGVVDEIHDYLKKCGHTDKDIFGYFIGIRVKKTAKEFIGRMKKVHKDFLELQEKWSSEAASEAEREAASEAASEAAEQELFAAEDRPISAQE